MPRPVKTKLDFVRRYSTGEFGNASPTWDTVLEIEDGLVRKGLFHIRNRVAGGPTWYNLTYYDCLQKWAFLQRIGVDPKTLYVSAMCPTEKTLFQGEVQRSERGLDLYYTTVAKPMRDALKEWSNQVYGLTAKCFLESFMCPGSYGWLSYLLASYPSHVIEFTTLSVNWGTLPGYNTIFWECRAY